MLLSVVVLLLMAAVVLLVVAGLTAVPFVVAVDMAERRRFSATRWGGLQLALLAVAALVFLVGWRHGHLLLLGVPSVLLCWLTPLVLSLLSTDDGALGGYQGAHEA
jgi:hypothetical protein